MSVPFGCPPVLGQYHGEEIVAILDVREGGGIRPIFLPLPEEMRGALQISCPSFLTLEAKGNSMQGILDIFAFMLACGAGEQEHKVDLVLYKDPKNPSEEPLHVALTLAWCGPNEDGNLRPLDQDVLINPYFAAIDPGASKVSVFHRDKAAHNDQPRRLEGVSNPSLLVLSPTRMLQGDEVLEAIEKGRMGGLIASDKECFRDGTIKTIDERRRRIKVERHSLARLFLNKVFQRFKTRTLICVTYPVNETSLGSLEARVRPLRDHGHDVILLRESEALAFAGYQEIIRPNGDRVFIILSYDMGHYTTDGALIEGGEDGVMTTLRTMSTGQRIGSFNKEVAIVAELLHELADVIKGIKLQSTVEKTCEVLLRKLSSQTRNAPLLAARALARELYLCVAIEGYERNEQRLEELRNRFFVQCINDGAEVDFDFESWCEDVARNQDSLLVKLCRRQYTLLWASFEEARRAVGEDKDIVLILGGGDSQCRIVMEMVEAEPLLPDPIRLDNPREATARGAYWCAASVASPGGFKLASASHLDRRRLTTTVYYDSGRTRVVLGQAGELLKDVNDRLSRGNAAPVNGVEQSLGLDNIGREHRLVRLFRHFMADPNNDFEKQEIGGLLLKDQHAGGSLQITLDEIGLPTAKVVKGKDELSVDFQATDFFRFS